MRFIHQSVQSLSCVWLFASPWTQSMPGLPVHHQLLDFTQTHVHWVSELFLHWSLVAYWAPTNLGSSSFSVLSFCLFILLMGFSRQEYWSGLPFPSPVDHILSELSTITRLSWVALHSMTHSCIELRQGCGPCGEINYYSLMFLVNDIHLYKFMPWIHATYANCKK